MFDSVALAYVQSNQGKIQPWTDFILQETTVAQLKLSPIVYRL